MPGNVVEIHQGNNGDFYIYKQSCYWNCKKISIENQKQIYKGDFDQGMKKLEEMLFEVLEGQSLSDVPLGIFLSGGIDSSLVTALMQRVSKEN